MATKRRVKPHHGVAFSNEALLREALLGLLRRIPEVTLLEHTHGSGEKGKDLVFRLPGGPGSPIVCAAVVKNLKISGSASAKNGAPNILHQVRQALAGTTLEGDGSRRRVQKVFVITNYELGSGAIESIREQLQGDLAGRVEFVGGPSLVELFRTYWPEFMQDEYEAIRHHLGGLAQFLNADATLSAIRAHYSLGTDTSSLTKYYVHPDLVFSIVAYARGPGLTRIRDSFIRGVLVDVHELLRNPLDKNSQRIGGATLSADRLAEISAALDPLRTLVSSLEDAGICSTSQGKASFSAALDVVAWIRELRDQQKADA